MVTKKQKRKKKQAPSKVIKRIWVAFLSGLFLFIVFMVLLSKGVFGYMPDIIELQNPKTKLATEIFSSDGEVLGKFYHLENRTNVNFSDLPTFLVNALVATEDVRFYKHSGIDLEALLRAVAFMGRRGGGSTLTQQLAKNLFHDAPSSKFGRIIQKFKEWEIAVQLEKRYTKQEIIMMYLNTVDFGNSFGIKSAANKYFNKEVKYLSNEEAAVLVGMLKAPTKYNPYSNPENSFKRRNVVLKQVYVAHFITKEKKDSLQKLDLVLDVNIATHNQGQATYFREHLRQYMHKWCKKNGYSVYNDGLKIYTTIDSRLQNYAENAVQSHMKTLQGQLYREIGSSKTPPWRDDELKWKEDKTYIPKQVKRTQRYRLMRKGGISQDSIDRAFATKRRMTLFSWNGEIDTMMTPLDSLKYCKKILHTGFMAMDPQSGHIKAWVGGISNRFFQYDHVNKNATRQVGSTFKPLVYARAIEDGVIQPCEKIPSGPVTFDLEDGKTWTPRNSGNQEIPNPIEVLGGLKGSLNTVTARVMKRMEPNSPIKVKDFSDRLGIATDKFQPYPSICLGTMDVSVFEMVGAYGAFVNQGTYTEPIFITRIEDKHGNVLEEFFPQTQEAMNKYTAYTMCKMLQHVVNSGTAVRLRYKYRMTEPIGGKTGTTQDNSDGWFMGISPDLVAGCWVGAEDRKVHFRNTSLGQGANMALPIYAMFMQDALKDKELALSKEDFKKPEGKNPILMDCNKYENERDDDDDDDDDPIDGIN
jgi:penicillin-binding protein 1A